MPGLVRAALTALIAATIWAAARPSAAAETPREPAATILVYHRFGPVVADNMTVTTRVFAWQLEYLRENHYAIVPLRSVVNFVLGRERLPPHAVAIAADDGHRTVFTEMKPLVERYRIPVTLFIYPSAISNAPYAMTWAQLRALKATGLFDIQSHTYWHPNFHVEKRRRSPAGYRSFVRDQLLKSKERLEQKLGGKVEVLAWPFGIYDDELIALARESGYIAGFSIERRPVTAQDNVMALPRYLMTDQAHGGAFKRIVECASDLRPGVENVR